MHTTHLPTPFIREDDKVYLQDISDIHPENQSCIWVRVKSGEINLEDYELLTTVEVEHSYGHPSLFKPSLAEVCKAIPANIADKELIFEIDYYGFTEDKSNHLSICTFYTKK